MEYGFQQLSDKNRIPSLKQGLTQEGLLNRD